MSAPSTFKDTLMRYSRTQFLRRLRPVGALVGVVSLLFPAVAHAQTPQVVAPNSAVVQAPQAVELPGSLRMMETPRSASVDADTQRVIEQEKETWVQAQAQGAGPVLSRAALAEFGQSQRIVPDGPFVSQRLHWRACADFGEAGAGVPSGVQCAFLVTPVDPQRPGLGNVASVLAKLPASGVKKGTLFTNPGGPGVSGISSPLSYFANSWSTSVAKRLHSEYDIISLTPRGVAESVPALACANSAAYNAGNRSVEKYFEDPQTASAVSLAFRQWSNSLCSPKELAARVGTHFVVEDLDIARQVVGDAKLNYLGFSYGTTIGGWYARTYPERVEMMILDGMTDQLAGLPEERTGTFSDFPVVTQGQSFENTLNYYLKRCLVEDKVAVGTSSGRCPLGPGYRVPNPTSQDIENAKAKLDRIGNWFHSVRPEGVMTNNGLFTITVFATATMAFLYSQNYWKYFSEGLNQLTSGQAASVDFQSTVPTRVGTPSYLYQIGAGYAGGNVSTDSQMYAVNCLDSSPASRAAECEGFAESTPLTEPILTSPQPIITLGNAFDPATPVIDAVVGAQVLGAGLLVSNMASHGSAVMPDAPACVGASVNLFLDNPADFASAWTRAASAYPTKYLGSSGVDTVDLYSRMTVGTQCWGADGVAVRKATYVAKGIEEPAGPPTPSQAAGWWWVLLLPLLWWLGRHFRLW